jgi:uncharacterized membrane protein
MTRETSLTKNAVGVNDSVKFDAVLHPHTSLGPRAFLLLMAVLGFISFIAGISFVMIGAWPVFGFIGLDIALVYMAFRINYTGARRYETLKLTESTLTVEQFSPHGKCQSWQFQPYWLQVDMEDPPQPDSPLTLRSHGEALEIGSFLTPGEKQNLAITLRTELDRLRHPTIAS